MNDRVLLVIAMGLVGCLFYATREARLVDGLLILIGALAGVSKQHKDVPDEPPDPPPKP